MYLERISVLQLRNHTGVHTCTRTRTYDWVPTSGDPGRDEEGHFQPDSCPQLSRQSFGVSGDVITVPNWCQDSWGPNRLLKKSIIPERQGGEGRQ